MVSKIEDLPRPPNRPGTDNLKKWIRVASGLRHQMAGEAREAWDVHQTRPVRVGAKAGPQHRGQRVLPIGHFPLNALLGREHGMIKVDGTDVVSTRTSRLSSQARMCDPHGLRRSPDKFRGSGVGPVSASWLQTRTLGDGFHLCAMFVVLVGTHLRAEGWSEGTATGTEHFKPTATAHRRHPGKLSIQNVVLLSER